jgi:hypothetical protein
MNMQDMTSKQISDKLAENGIKMHFNSKREKLEEALNNLTITEGDNMEVQATQTTQATPTAVLITDDMLDDIKIDGVELEGLRDNDAMKLIRVIVRPNDPLKLDSGGEIFTYGSNVINNGKAVKKYVPFNNEEGWHIPNIIYQNIVATECQIFKKVTRNGQDTMEAVKIKSYNVEVLPALTQDEIDKIAIRQKSTSSVG